MLRATICFLLLALTPIHAGKPSVRDGSTMKKAIPLKQRGAKAVEEEMQWMMKLYHYTPALATRDEIAQLVVDAIRRTKAGQKQPTGQPPQPWQHGTLDHNGQVCSYWWFRTPHGKKEIYFDAGVPINTPGEVARQESACAQYMQQAMKSLKLQ
jgi:hypothetical protein